jgi:hypothetical protein
VLALCRVDDAEKAQLGLYICSELADLFANDWSDRVASLVESLVEQGLPKAYHGAVSYAAIRLIRIFHIERLVPLVRRYLKDLNEAIKEGGIPRIEFKTLLYEISRMLITVSPNDFWSEFSSFCQDQALMSEFGGDFFELAYFWASSGVRLYGLAWLRRLTAESPKIPNEDMRRIIYRAVREEAKYSAATSGDERAAAEFLRWLEETIGAPQNGEQ